MRKNKLDHFRSMIQIFRNRYFITFLIVYTAAITILHFGFRHSFADSLFFALIFGICFPMITWLLVRHLIPWPEDKPGFKSEKYILAGLVLFIIWYISYGTGWMNFLVSQKVLREPWKNSFFVLFKKLLVFVIIPFSIYSLCGFGARDFGLSVRRPGKKLSRSVVIFVSLSILVVVFQVFLGHGSEQLRKGQFSVIQLLLGLPLCFLWYFLEAGLVEEFFFRSLLQARLSVWLKSNTGGIVFSGLIFGLAHAPGLYLRGASSEGISEQLPFLFWAAYTISIMSLAGIFLGIVWSRTKNIYLVMAIHAMVDLLPNVGDFVVTWHIR
jgi:uncharacterized protein